MSEIAQESVQLTSWGVSVTTEQVRGSVRGCWRGEERGGRAQIKGGCQVVKERMPGPSCEYAVGVEDWG